MKRRVWWVVSCLVIAALTSPVVSLCQAPPQEPRRNGAVWRLLAGASVAALSYHMEKARRLARADTLLA